MENMMTMQANQLLVTNIIYALYCTETKQIQVFSSQQSALYILDKMYGAFKLGGYKNKELQDSFNKGSLKFVLLESNSDLNQYHPDVNLFVLRLKEQEYCTALASDGYIVIPGYNPLKIQAKVVYGKRGYYPQVRLKTARGKVYFVQKEFINVERAKAYIEANTMLQMVIDTRGLSTAYRAIRDINESQATAVVSVPAISPALAESEEREKTLDTATEVE